MPIPFHFRESPFRQHLIIVQYELRTTLLRLFIVALQTGTIIREPNNLLSIEWACAKHMGKECVCACVPNLECSEL